MSPRVPHRFYFAGHLAQQSEELVALSRDESHHLLHVLRLKPGTQVDLFDAAGRSWSAEVVDQVEGQARLRLLYHFEEQSGTPTGINLAVAVLKRRAMDLMIEKLTELGVETIQPLLSARCVGLPDIAPHQETPPRWDRIALAAAKQSGRTVPLNILRPAPVGDWLERMRPPAHTVFAHDAYDAQTIGHWAVQSAGSTSPVWVAIGPEGGWTDDEAKAFEQAGFDAVRMGDLTLRAETAAIAAAALCRLVR